MAIPGSDGSITLTTAIDDSGIRSGISKITKTIGVLGTAGTAAFAALVKSAASSFAEYEQLVGGVETLFKESANMVKDYAANAYETAGMSANEYMSTVTSFSASLLQSLGQDTEKAAQYADKAIIDMADNANKMGTDMQRIQDAYQGFAKQNYTMLDNLKLGYGGTKTEMERLIADANKLKKANGEMANLSINSFADVVEAIHTVQTEMGITGTTAKEASDTIQGSIASMKASWSNLLTGIADENADLKKLMSQFGDSVVTVFKNLAPVVKQAVSALPKVITELGSELAKAAPELLGNLIPELIQGGFTIVETLVQTVSENAHRLGEAAAELAVMFIQGILSIVPQLFEAGAEFVSGFVDGLASQYPKITAAITTITGIFAGLKVASFTKGIINDVAKLGTGFLQMAGKIDEATKSQLLLNAAQKANVIGIVITAITALIGLTRGLVAVNEEYLEQNSALVQGTKAMADAAKEAAANADDLAESLSGVVESGEDAVQNAKAEAQANQTLADELYDLAAKEELTAENKERMKTIVDQLNESISNLNLKFDEETGQLNLTKDAVYKLIQAKMELAQVEAFNSTYVDYLKEAYKTEAELTRTLRERAEATAEMNSLEGELLSKYGTTNPIMLGTFASAKMQVDETYVAYKNAKVAVEDFDNSVATLNTTLNNAEQDMLAISTAAGVALPENYSRAGREAIKLKEDSEKALLSLPASTQTAINGINAAFQGLQNGDISIADFVAVCKSKLGELPPAAQEMVLGIIKSFSGVEVGGDAFNKAVDKSEKALLRMPKAAETSTTKTVEAFKKLSQGEITFDEFSKSAEQSFSLLSPAAQTAVSEIITSFMGLSNGTIGMEQFVENLKASMANLPPSAQAAVQSIITAFAQLNAGEIDAESFKETVATALASLTTEAGTIGASIPTEMASGIDGGKSSVESSAGGVKDGAVAKLEAASEAFSKGQDFGTGYGDGIGAMGSYVYDKAYAIAQQALQAVQDSQASSSPSKKAAKLGRDFSGGYALGIDDGEKDVNKVAGNLALSALESVRETQDSHSPAEATAGLGEDFADGYAAGIERETDAVVAASENMVNAAIDPIQKGIAELNLKPDPKPYVSQEEQNRIRSEEIERDLRIDPKVFSLSLDPMNAVNIRTITDPRDGELISKWATVTDRISGNLIYKSDLKQVQLDNIERAKQETALVESLGDAYTDAAKKLEGSYLLGKISYEDYIKELEGLAKDQQDRRFRLLDHALAMDVISEEEYYDSLQALRDEYFAEGSDEWMDYTEEIYAFRKQQREDEYQEAQEMFEEYKQQELDNLDTMLNFGLISEKQYYQELANFRDKYFVKGSKEWKDYTLQIYDYRLSKNKDLLAEVETAEKTMFDKLSSYGALMDEKPENTLASVHPLFELKQNKNGEEFYRINPIRNQTKDLQKYYDTLTKLRDREGMDSDLFDIVKNMSFEESMEYAKLLMRMGDEQFNKYIADWRDKQALSKQISDDIFGKKGKLSSEKVLTDLNAQTETIEEYGRVLMAVNNRGALPKDFFEMMRNMGVEEGLDYAKALLDLSDEDFVAYIEAWERKTKSSQDVAKSLYAEETEKLYSETKDTFESFIGEFLGFGENAGKKFQLGFTSILQSMFKKLNLLNLSSSATSAFFNNLSDGIDWTGIYSSPYVNGTVLPTNREFSEAIYDKPIGPVNPYTVNSEWMNSATTQPQQTTVVLEIDGREFGSAVLEYGGQESRRVGTTIGGTQ